MTGQKFTNYVRKLAGANSNTFPDADILLFANAEKDEIAYKLLKASEDVFLTPQTTNLEADTREYPLPENILNKIKKVEALFDGSTWIPVHEMDQSQFRGTSDEATIVSYFNNQEADRGNPYGARYDIRRKAIYLYSGTITAVTSGLKVHTEEYPADLVTAQLSDDADDLSKDPSTTTYGLPKEFHQIWAKMTAKAWKEAKEKPIPETLSEVILKAVLAEKVAEYTPVSTDRVDTFGEPTEEETYNNGFDL